MFFLTLSLPHRSLVTIKITFCFAVGNTVGHINFEKTHRFWKPRVVGIHRSLIQLHHVEFLSQMPDTSLHVNQQPGGPSYTTCEFSEDQPNQFICNKGSLFFIKYFYKVFGSNHPPDCSHKLWTLVIRRYGPLQHSVLLLAFSFAFTWPGTSFCPPVGDYIGETLQCLSRFCKFSENLN